MSQIKITYGNVPVAESGYLNLKWQEDNGNPFNPKISVEVPLASGSLAGVLKITGDIGGVYNDPVVVGIQGTPVNNTAPTDKQFLQIISGAWKPHTLVAADISDLSTTLATIYQAKVQKDAVGGYAGLDGSGLVPLTEIPALPESRITGLTSDLSTLATAISTETSRAEGVEATLQPLLGYTAENVANKDTTTALGTSDTKYPSQKAVKTYVDAAIAALTDDDTSFELLINKDTTVTLGTSNTKYPSQLAVKTYVDNAIGGFSGTLAGDTDVSLTTLVDGQVLTFDGATSKWKNRAPTGGGGGSGTFALDDGTFTTGASDFDFDDGAF